MCLLAIEGDDWVAGNLSYHLKSRPKWISRIRMNTIAKCRKVWHNPYDFVW